MFYDPNQFPYLKEISKHYDAIKEEFLNVADARQKPTIDSHITPTGWRGFPLMSSGYIYKENWALCPQTTALVKDIPGLYAVGFYILDPKTDIPKHKNFPMDIYRMHMGVLVPPDCAFRVGKEIQPWVEKEWFVFCPEVEHEGYNRSASRRVVLIVDVWRHWPHRPLRDRFLTWLGGVKIRISFSGWGKRFLNFVSTNRGARRVVDLLTGRK
ncbi:MAG: hypothetical protein LDLANPLL_02858 [Turneriella sp.]|nr:hypothetical protein [Turneriella sp.]